MKFAKNFHKAYTFYLGIALTVLPQAIQLVTDLSPYLGESGGTIISGLGILLTVLRALPQPEVDGE